MQFFMFGGIVTATRYGDILSASLIPFLRKTYPNGADSVTSSDR